MSEQTNQHLPSPEFRASLEREVVQTFRRQSQFSAPPSVARRARLRTAAALVIGLALGVGGAVATAQVQSTKVRDSLTLSAELEQKVQLLKLEVAEANYERIKKAVDAGARSRIDLGEAEFDIARANWLVSRTRLDLEEIKATNRAPGYELWSPLVDGRDFITERLKAEAAFVTGKLALVERRLADSRAKVLVGAAAAADSLDAQVDVINFGRDLEYVAQQLEWRRKFLDKKMTELAIGDARMLYSYQSDIRAAAYRYQRSLIRAKRAKELQEAGAATLLDARRAEVEAMEDSLQLYRMQQSFKLMQASRDLLKSAQAAKKAKTEPPA